MGISAPELRKVKQLLHRRIHARRLRLSGCGPQSAPELR